MQDRMYITYPRGRMELSLSQFFPCTVKVARIVFPLINLYACAPEKEKLRQHLKAYMEDRQKEMKDMEEDYKADIKRPGSNYRHIQTMYKRALRNMEFLEE